MNFKTFLKESKKITMNDIKKAMKRDGSVILTVDMDDDVYHVSVDSNSFDAKSSAVIGSLEDGEEIEFEFSEIISID